MTARNSSSTGVRTDPERKNTVAKETTPEDQARRAVIVGPIKRERLSKFWKRLPVWRTRAKSWRTRRSFKTRLRPMRRFPKWMRTWISAMRMNRPRRNGKMTGRSCPTATRNGSQGEAPSSPSGLRSSWMATRAAFLLMQGG